MNGKKLYFVLVGSIVLLLVGLIVSTYQINTILGKKAGELNKLKAKSMALDQERLSLVKAKSDIKKYEELHEITKSVVPEDKNQAAVVREIVSIASKNKISLSSISFPASSLGSSAKSSSSTSTTSTSTSSSATATASSKAGALSQLQPVKNIAGVYSLTITIASSPTEPVPYDQFIKFLEDLEHNRRTAQVSTITIEPKKENRNVLSFTLTLNAYIKP